MGMAGLSNKAKNRANDTTFPSCFTKKQVRNTLSQEKEMVSSADLLQAPKFIILKFIIMSRMENCMTLYSVVIWMLDW